MRFLLTLLCLVSLNAFADGVSFENDREGETYYSSRKNKRDLAKALKQVPGEQILLAYDEVLQETSRSKLCSFDVNEALREKLKARYKKFNELPGALFYLRSENKIDDTVVKILLLAEEISETRVYSKRVDELRLPEYSKVQEIMPVIGSFEGRFLRNNCFDDAYKSMYGEIRRIHDSVSSAELEGLLYEALELKLIDLELYEKLEQARKNELETSGMSLRTYHQKISSLRLQYPLRDPEEKSVFVTQKLDKMKKSRRQHLLENYSDVQIVFMGNIIKKLRTRLEAPKAEILIYDRNQEVETITLEPMERFRLAIKLLRKEMAYLSLNTFFNGGAPSYLDLMTAAFELGIIPASELDELASIEEIWNPKKTFWEKARVWVMTFGTVATIVIPPPYGFIPALAIVVIEYTAGNNNDNQEDPTSLF